MESALEPSSRSARSRSRAKSTLSRDPQRELQNRDYVIGICLLLVVVFLWSFSNFVTQDLFQGGYEKPFLITYLNTSSFALYLVPVSVRRTLDRRRASRALDAGVSDENSPLLEEDDAADDPYSGLTQTLDVPYQTDELSPLTVRQTIDLAFMFCIFWFIANWSVNAALNYTSVASTTILASLSGFFTLIIGRLFKVESLTMGKILTVVTSFIGSLLVASSDSFVARPSIPPAPPQFSSRADIPYEYNSQPILGDSLALLSAAFYALYVVLLKVRIRDESRIDMQLFFGFVGFVNIVCCWPIGFILHFTKVELFELPSTRQAITAILLNMAITVSSDFIYVIAMLKTTPLVVTIGLSLTIPLAVLGDFLLGRPARGQVLLGATLVLISFVAVGFQSADPETEDGRAERSRERSSSRHV